MQYFTMTDTDFQKSLTTVAEKKKKKKNHLSTVKFEYVSAVLLSAYPRYHRKLFVFTKHVQMKKLHPIAHIHLKLARKKYPQNSSQGHWKYFNIKLHWLSKH